MTDHGFLPGELDGAVEGGLSWDIWKGAAALLAREGFDGPADAIENILAGADPRDEFCLSGLRSERKAIRNGLIEDLFRDCYEGEPLAKAVSGLASDWRHYEGRAAARDRLTTVMPTHYSLKWQYFWQIAKLGEKVPCSRQIRNIIAGL
ncbi:hypothetical protein [Aurantiacibacter hainanensis]|uniref:hypothetical protein n=1 Tax=Aurantiacibacter hainanensis TaxID=3076114 RepID=UPI0030C68850